MRAEEIRDRETLEAWLKDQPREVAVMIAARAALRVVPEWFWFLRGNEVVETGQEHLLRLFRCALTAPVFLAKPIHAVVQAADSAADAAAVTTASAKPHSNDAYLASYAATGAAAACVSKDASAYATTCYSLATEALRDEIVEDAVEIEASCLVAEAPLRRLWPRGLPS